MVLFIFLLIVGAIAALAYGVMSLVKASNAYQNAVSLARQDERVRAELGEPVEVGWFVTGRVHTSNSTESADLTIPLRGSRSDGTLYVLGSRAGGRWRYAVLEVEVKRTGQRIPLMGHLPAGGGATPNEALPAEPAPDELPSEAPQ